MISNCANIVPCLGLDCKKTFVCDENYVNYDGSLPQKDAMCNCLTIMCMRCKKAGHEPISCENNKSWGVSLQELNGEIDKRMSDIWIKKNTKKCPECDSDIQKNGGCMHMTCKNCRYEFCWLCLKKWINHDSFYSCNKFKPKAASTKNEEDDIEYLERLKFYMKRYEDHNDACEQIYENLKKLCIKLNRRSGTYISKFNNFVMPGSLDFYIEAYSSVLFCRRFAMNCYPLALKIRNEDKNLLFSQTQFFLEMAVEKLSKYIIDNPLEEFVYVDNEGQYFTTKGFDGKKAKIVEMEKQLKSQFYRARKEFSDPDFRNKVDKEFLEWKRGRFERARIKAEREAAERARRARIPPTNWNCTRCTFWNANNNTNVCVMCELIGRPLAG